MESFVTTVALIGIVIVIASLLSGAIERTGLPLVPIFLLLARLPGHRCQRTHERDRSPQ